MRREGALSVLKKNRMMDHRLEKGSLTKGPEGAIANRACGEITNKAGLEKDDRV